MPKPTATERRPLIQGLLGVNASGSAAAERVVDIPVTDIRPNPEQPRKDFPPESLLELGQSIKDKGLQQPIVVRLLAGQDHEKPAYELVMGERRLRASQAVGLKTIRAIVRDTPDDDLLHLAMVENIHREDLSLLDRAVAFCNFADRFHHGKVEPAAAALRISRMTGFNYKRIGGAQPQYQSLIRSNQLDTRGSTFLLGLVDKVAKQHPGEVETFNKALADGDLGFAKLKELHDFYFPAPAEKDEPPMVPAHKTHEQPVARADEKKGAYTKTPTEHKLFINYDPSKGKPPAKLTNEWARAATKFFHDAGFKTVKIEP
jgi:ParB family chromosome partitioning protein